MRYNQSDFFHLPIICLAIGLIFAPLLQTGCGTLAKDGVYQSDKALYSADMTIASSYDLLYRFVIFERQNRVVLASPEIKAAADRIRLGAPTWFASALNLRDAYKLNPTGANRNALNSAMAVLHAAVLESTRYLIANHTFEK